MLLSINPVPLTIFFRLSFFLFFFFSSLAFPQQNFLQIERDITANYEQLTSSKEMQFHSSVKPFLQSDLQQFINIDSIINSNNTFGMLFKKDTAAKKNYIELSPLFFLHSGYETLDTNRMVAGTAIGATLNADLWKKLYFNANFLSANTAFPSFIQNYVDSTKVVPAEGYSHPAKIGSRYNNFSGYVSYSSLRFLNFQLAHGKNFLGDGYRSLLLSDVTNNYSFLKITTTIWKIKYVNILANLKDVHGTYTDNRRFRNKYATFHYLSWNTTRWLNLGLFESVIWQVNDTLNHRGFDVNYMNPVVFYRPVEYSLGSSDNVLMGVNIKVKITDKIQLYGQIIIDEFLLSEVKARSGWWANKYGGQFGVKYFNAFGLKNLMLQTETNEVRPYTYSHGSTMQNYAHFNQPLAHPLGANFSEVLAILRYNKGNFSAEAKTVIAKFGTDTANINYGGDIYKSYEHTFQQYGNKTGQGVQNYLLLNEIKTTYLIFPKINLKAEMGVLFREKYRTSFSQKNFYLWFGLRTTLYNVYRDFM